MLKDSDGSVIPRALGINKYIIIGISIGQYGKQNPMTKLFLWNQCKALDFCTSNKINAKLHYEMHTYHG